MDRRGAEPQAVDDLIGDGIAAPDFLLGGGEMGALMRAHDWSKTPLGSPDAWPQSLRSAVSICLGSSFPIAIYWGRELALLYNDAWSPIPGTKHPWALGRGAGEVWPEIWDTIGPMFEHVMETGEATRSEDQLLPMRRHGYTEECYFNYTFSPIRGESGRVEGIFNAVVETTFGVIGERRTRLLRELAERIAPARSAEDACRLAAETLGTAPADVPFCLLYVLDADGGGRRARLAGAAALDPGGPASPASIDVTDTAAPWPMARVVETGEAELVEGLAERFGFALPGGPWPEPAQDALVVPIAAVARAGDPAGLLITGVSPRRALDDEYRAFLDRAATHIASAVANARAYEEERKRAEALAEIDRAKTAFFSNVSHEFRTPLTLMLGPLEDALAQPDRLPPGERESLALALRNGLRLLKLVNSLLDFSRIEAGRVQACYEPTELAAYTAELASIFRSAIEKAGLRLTVDCPPLLEPVHVDREMWEKIVLNLLSNAFKFTFEGEIEVRLRPAGELVELTVRDTGTGIPDRELPRIFERFHRIEGARGRTYEGSGIGLALVQELVKLHGGTVRVDSAIEAGTTFTVAIPTGTAHLPADRIDASHRLASPRTQAESFVEEALRWLPEGAPTRTRLAEIPPDQAELSAFPRRRTAAKQQDRARILLVDDNADMRDYVRRLLEARYEVETAADGEAAWTAIRGQRPDLVLADVMMPRLDGFGLLRAIRMDPDTADLPIVLLSARAGEEARVEGLDAGANDYLAKPFSARELLARVGANLETARLRREAVARERNLRAEAEGAQRRAEHILESIGDAFYALDAAWRFTYVNRKTEALWGRPRGTLIGKVIWEEFPQAVGTEAHERHLEAARERRTVSFQAVSPILHRWLDVTIYSSGTGVTVYFRDIEDRKRTEQALRESEDRLRLAVEATEMGTWDIDPVAGTRTWSDRCKALFGLPPDADVTYEVFLARLHPEDRERTHRAVQKALDPAGDGELDIEYRAIGQRDGVERWIADKGRAFFQDGRAVRLVGTALDITERKRAQEALREETRTLETLNRTGAALAAELDYERIVQSVTDAATELAGARFGSFFYNVQNERGESYMLYTLSGAPHEAFEKFPMPRNTAVFEPTFRGTAIVRSDDITKDPRYGKSPPHHGMPKGHLPVRSYLAVPVISRSGEVLGGLFFGHEQPGVFTARSEHVVAGIAAQAAIAIDNARLYADAQREIAERKRAEEHQRLLLHELNHRVKNTLAAVQSIALQTLQSTETMSAFRESFDARLMALSQAHNLLTRESWRGAALWEVVLAELAPYREAPGPRLAIEGPEVRLGPKPALALGMAFHELTTNAAKYGALSVPGGRVEIVWTVRASETGERLDLLWREIGGPTVVRPQRKGFGSRLIERGLAHELDGEVQLDFCPSGVRCRIDLPLPTRIEIE